QYIVAAAACTFVTGLLAYFGAPAINLSEFDTKSFIHVVALGPALAVVYLWLMFILWTGVVGNTYSEFTREWLNRFLGEMSGLAAIWMIAGGLMVYARPIWLWVVASSGGLIRPYLAVSASSFAVGIGLAGLAGWLFWRLRRSRAERAEPETKRTGLMVL